MVSEIRIYVEGGGDGRDSKATVREGFSAFLNEPKSLARERRIRWSIIACGPRNDAHSNFLTALETHIDAFNILLVDSEGPVRTRPWAHLHERDGWIAQGMGDDNCHLMVQMMEAWLIADPDALKGFYGRNFRVRAIPKNPDVEEIAKSTINRALDTATEKTTKGPYQKIRHGGQLLGIVDVPTVRRKAPHCERLFRTLEQEIIAA